MAEGDKDHLSGKARISLGLNLPGGILVYAAGEGEHARHQVAHPGKRLDVYPLDQRDGGRGAGQERTRGRPALVHRSEAGPVVAVASERVEHARRLQERGVEDARDGDQRDEQDGHPAGRPEECARGGGGGDGDVAPGGRSRHLREGQRPPQREVHQQIDGEDSERAVEHGAREVAARIFVPSAK